MKILNYYMGRSIVLFILLVLLLLIGVEGLIHMLGELKDLGRPGYGMLQVLTYVGLSLPGDVYQFFPMAVLLGTILGVGHLVSTHELLIMRVAGVSPLQLMGIVLQSTLLVLVFVTIIGEVIAPVATQRAADYKSEVLSGGQVMPMHKDGWWVKEGNRFIHVAQMVSDRELKGVNQYVFDKQQKLILTAHAKEARLESGRWFLYQVSESRLGKDRVRSAYFPKQIWQVKLNPHWLKLSQLSPEMQSLVKLKGLMAYRQQRGGNVSEYAVIFWKRVCQPLATLVMAWIAAMFALGTLRTAAAGLRLLVGILLGVLFYLLNQVLVPLSMLYQLPPLLGALLPSLLFIMLSVCLAQILHKITR